MFSPGAGIGKLWELWKLGSANRKISFRRLLNLIVVYFQWKIFRTKKTYGYPFKLIVDPSSICQLHCPLCPTGQGDQSRGRGFMDLVKYKGLIDEVSSYVIFIDLFNWGEPLLNKKLPDMIRYASKKGLVTRINTNLNFFSRKMAKDLVESRPDVLIVSLDGASQETYSKYRKGGNFDEVIIHIQWIVEEKKKQKTKKPFLVWQFLAMKHNEHEIPTAKKIALEIGVNQVVLHPVRCDMGKEIFMTDEEKIKKTEAWLPAEDTLSRYDYQKKQRKLNYKYCHHLWTKSTVNWDGSVSPCCGIYDKKHDFGNAFEEKSFKSIWNNQKFQRAREIIAKQEKGAKDNIVCRACLKTGYID